MGPTAWGVDAASRITIETLRKEGASFVCLYLAPYPEQQWKIRTIADTRAYLDAGFHVVMNWESSGHPDGGFAAGVRDAHIAQAELNDRHMADAPVYFTAADEQFPNLADLLAYHRGVSSVIPWERTGCYGSADVIDYLHSQNACRYYWQTYAWSGGRISGNATLYQRKNTPTIDYDVALALDFGQYPRPAVPAGPLPKGWQDMQLTDTWVDWAGHTQTLKGYLNIQDSRSYHIEQMLLQLVGSPGTSPRDSAAQHSAQASAVQGPTSTPLFDAIQAEGPSGGSQGALTDDTPSAWSAPSWTTGANGNDWSAPEEQNKLVPNPGPVVPGAHYSQQWGR